MTDATPLDLNVAVPGGRVRIFAIRDEEYPGGWFYRFQYYNPDEGPLLRYDNAHEDPDAGWHHRHITENDKHEIPFQNLVAHIARFFREIDHITNQENGRGE